MSRSIRPEAPVKPKAPTSHEASTLVCNQVSCEWCDWWEAWTPGSDASAWRCDFCGDQDEDGEEDPRPVWEHVSLTPLGFRDDKACHWPPIVLADGSTLEPERWVYKASVPA